MGIEERLLRQAEDELTMRETRYRALLETDLEAICCFLPDTTLTFVNRGYCKICGRKHSDLIGRKWKEFVPENARGKIMRTVETIAYEMQAGHYEHEVITSNGQVRWVDWYVYPITDEAGRLVEFQSVGRDVSGQKQTERALRESEQRFRDLADKSPVGIYLLEDGVAKYLNQPFADMHGYTADELINRNTLKTLVHPDDWDKAERRSVDRLKGGVGPKGKFSFRGVTKAGETIYVETYAAVTTYEGRPAVIGTGIDVTERIRIEEELKNYKDHLEKLVEERTMQLNQANEELQQDIARRKEVESALDAKSRSLEEVNTALKVLLRQREDDRSELEEKVYSNVKDLVLRYTHMLRETRPDSKQTGLLDIIEANLNKIISPFSKRLSAFDFTPKETEVISLIKEGKTSKDIADLLGVSLDAISQHRYQIRRKLSLNRKKTGLRSYLLTLE